eukprot:scaffold59493_cov30-Cyclotella_meneghiniana.AAC.4
MWLEILLLPRELWAIGDKYHCIHIAVVPRAIRLTHSHGTDNLVWAATNNNTFAIRLGLLLWWGSYLFQYQKHHEIRKGNDNILLDAGGPLSASIICYDPAADPAVDHEATIYRGEGASQGSGAALAAYGPSQRS